MSEESTKLDERLDRIEATLNTMNASIAATLSAHTQSINTHDREVKELRVHNEKQDERISKLEHMVWAALGAGGFAGFGISKLFM